MSADPATGPSPQGPGLTPSPRGLAPGPSSPGRHIVLLHGGGVGPWMWDGVRALLPQDVKVSTPTLPGHGDGATFVDHLHAAQAVAGQVGLGADGGRATLVGFSLGGQTAIHLAAEHPSRVESLVVISSLVAPMPGAVRGVGGGRAAAPLARRRWFARMQARQLGVPEEAFERYLGTSAGLSADSLANLTRANSTFDAAPLLATFGRPVALVCGSREPRAVLDGLRALQARLENASLTVVKGAGHTLPFSHPEAVSQTI